MSDWFDILVVIVLVVGVLWGGAVGAYRPVCSTLALLIGVAVGARFSGQLGDTLNGLGTNPGVPMLQAVAFVLVLIVVTLIAFGILSALLGFMQPATRAAQEFLSARLFGAAAGLVFAIVLSAVFLMTFYLAGSGDVPAHMPVMAGMHPALNRASTVPALWRLVHAIGSIEAPLVGPRTPPFSQP